jgi:tetratricopeptide (TPR) repeat protein
MNEDDVRMERAHQLMSEGEEALQRGDFDSAERSARDLIKVGFTGGFELLARVRVEQGRIADAIATLERAVSVAPSVWLLWQLLGNLRSDDGRYDAAREAYARGMACDGADLGSLRINLSIAWLRARDATAALAVCDEITDPAWAIARRQVRVSALAELGRWEDVLRDTSVVPAELKEACERQDGDETLRSLAMTCASRAEALLHQTRDLAAARTCALASLEGNWDPPKALEVLRELAGTRSPNARFLRLHIKGGWSQPADAEMKIAGFLRLYDVVADDAEEGLRFARELELSRAHSLSIETIEQGDLAPAELKGVWFRSPYIFYQEQEEDR